MMKKIPLNSTTSIFSWTAPTAISGTPTLTIRMAAGDQSPALTPIHAPATATAIQNNRRTLTIAPPINNYLGTSGRWGEAHLETESDSAYPVLISRVAGSSAQLAEPLPRGIDLGGGSASLEWATWVCTLGAAVTSALGSYVWDITYVANDGTDAPSDTQTDSGLLSVVRRPFSSGLNHQGLVALVPALADMVPRRQQDFSPQIEVAEHEVALRVRNLLTVDGYTEDDLFNPHIFHHATALITSAIIYEGLGQLDTAQRYRDRGEAAFEQAGGSITLDINRDGNLGTVVNLATMRQRVTGGRRTDVRGNMSGRVASSNEMTPARGQRH